jgi:prepilin-type N-terminal cleavage/methylation domain-containing protein
MVAAPLAYIKGLFLELVEFGMSPTSRAVQFFTKTGLHKVRQASVIIGKPFKKLLNSKGLFHFRDLLDINIAHGLPYVKGIITKFYLESKRLGFTSDCNDEEFLKQVNFTTCKTCKYGSEESGLKAPFNKLFCLCPLTEGETLPYSDPYLTGYVNPDDRCSRWQPKEKSNKKPAKKTIWDILMNRTQKSKMARKIRKQAKYAGLHRNFSHPSHNAGIRRMERSNKKYRGVTLIELMIVYSILAILAAIAIPCYCVYIEKIKNIFGG